MIAVAIPAHDEESVIAACLASVFEAAHHPSLGGEPVEVIVAADACADATEAIALACGARVARVHARSVGPARAAAAELAVSLGARWLCFTDADSLVAPDWIAMHVAQLAEGADAVCGTVQVLDWGAYGTSLVSHWARTYRDADGHTHIHGANMSVSAAAYRACGGFAALPTSEDVALVRSLEQSGARIAWSAAPRVSTSARVAYKAPRGFGAELVKAGLALAA